MVASGISGQCSNKCTIIIPGIPVRNGVSHVREIARMSLKLMEAVKVMVMIISETVKTAMVMAHVAKVEVVMEVVVKEGQDIVLEEKVIYVWLECRLLSTPFLFRTLVILTVKLDHLA